MLPLSREFADYAEAIARAAARVASLEGRTAHSVLKDLHHPRKDTMRVGRTDLGSEDGSLDLDAAVSVISGMRRSLLAAACSVERPDERFHRRMSLKKAQSFVDECRLGQTEHGSFVLTVLCPLELQQLELERPFGRQTVEMLVGSVSKTVRLLRTDGIQRVVDEVQGITANLCDSLVEMMPKNERGDLWLGASWSPIVPAPSLPSRVQIDRDLYAGFEDLGRALRPPTIPKTDLFVGRDRKPRRWLLLLPRRFKATGPHQGCGLLARATHQGHPGWPGLPRAGQRAERISNSRTSKMSVPFGCPA